MLFNTKGDRKVKGKRRSVPMIVILVVEVYLNTQQEEI